MIHYINGKPHKNIKLRRRTFTQIVQDQARHNRDARLVNLLTK